MRRHQQGLTLMSFIIVLAVVGFAAFVGMKLFPMYQEYFAVKTAMKELAADPSAATRTPAQIKDQFFRKLYINYSDNVKPADVTFERASSGGILMTVDYEVRRSLIGNLDVVGKFNSSETLSNRGGE
ncbi:MAG: DUF4845 domain-containing protein [Pseudoxanthomonas suwonensis]|nr:DUF4845 domain-containing protein [Pseudoxanthomonas suwonensis]